jgi:hypothetical protein
MEVDQDRAEVINALDFHGSNRKLRRREAPQLLAVRLSLTTPSRYELECVQLSLSTRSWEDQALNPESRSDQSHTGYSTHTLTNPAFIGISLIT